METDNESLINVNDIRKSEIPVFGEIAKRMPDVTLGRYVSVYSPDTRANECCFRCAKSTGGCSWSRDLIPVDGWIALEDGENASAANGKPWYKIMYCPGFKMRSAKRKPKYCDEGIERLFRALAGSAGREYRNVISALRHYEQEIRDSRRGGEWLDREKFEQAVSGYILAYSALITARAGLLANVWNEIERREKFTLNPRLTKFCLKRQPETNNI